MLNKGKKSLKLDLKQVSKRKLLNPLILEADIIVEQFRPGVMKNLTSTSKQFQKNDLTLFIVLSQGLVKLGPTPVSQAMT